MRFGDDPALLHWRGVLIPIQGDEVVVVTPDRDIEVTTLRPGAVYTEVHRFDQGRLPAGVRDRHTYLPKHSGGGNIDAAEFRRLVGQGEKVLDRHRRRQGVGGKGGAKGADAADPEPEVEAGEGEAVSLVLYRSGGGQLGEELTPPADATQTVLNGKEFALFSMGGEEFLTRRVNVRDVARMQGLLQSVAVDPEPPEKDIRVLSVLFDSAEERWRTLAEAAPDLEEADYDDFPLNGPRTLYHDIRQLRRLGMDFVQHHESWVKKSGVRNTDRSVYEHASVCRVLNLMLCYDQLNVTSLASAEALNRRRTLIEQAHQGRPEAPSYEAAEDIMGIREAGDGSIIDPALTQFAAKKAAGRAEIMKQTRLAAEEKQHARKQGSEGKGGGKSSNKQKEKTGQEAPGQP